MKALNESARNKVTVVVVVKPKESILESAFKDFVSLIIIAFCVYISRESTWWTFITGGMFLVFSLLKIGGALNKQTNVFDNKEDAIKYISDKGEG